jgi:hypothetical protein
MKTHENMKALIHAFLTSALDGDERPASSLDLFTAWENLSVPIR